MAHNLTRKANGESMFAYNSRTGPPWHRLGQAVDGCMTRDEILTLAGLDWQVETGPVFDSIGNTLSDKVTYRKDEFGQRRHFAIVGKGYEVVQNAEFLKFMESIVAATGACWETAGALFDGRMVFASLDPESCPDLKMELPNGETLKTWIAGTNSHDGRRALSIFKTTIRPVCWNTVSAGAAQALGAIKLRHTSGITTRIEDVRRALALEIVGLAKLKAECDQLVMTPANPGVVQHWVEELFPIHTGYSPKLLAKRERQRIGVTGRALHGIGNDGKTLWSWYNGFTQYMEDVLTEAQQKGDAKALGRRLVSDLDGTRAASRDKARSTLLSIAAQS